MKVLLSYSKFNIPNKYSDVSIFLVATVNIFCSEVPDFIETLIFVKL